jgi:prophage tail gpP-like protein
MPPETIQLCLGGQVFEGWKSARVRRSLDGAAGSFDLSLSETHPDRPPARLIQRGAAVTVTVGRDTVITGYIDEREIPLSGEVSIRGRDRTADLVDCAPDLDPNEWRSTKLEDLARALAGPFGVAVRAIASTGAAFAKVALNPGQKAWDLLEERARYRGVVLMTDGLGALLIDAIGGGARAEEIVEGRNLLDGSATFTDTERYSEYVVRGQSPGSDFLSGAAIAAPEGRARDLGVGRFRQLVLVAASAVDRAQCEERAKREASVRAARSETVTASVQGWRQSNGRLWAPNEVTRFRSQRFGIDADLLVVSAEYRIDGSSTTTTLTLQRPEAFAAMPEPELAETGFGAMELG